MDSKTLNTGIATTLSDSPALAGWKRKGAKLVHKVGPTTLTLTLKKLNPRVLPPSQRVGMHVRLDLELRRSDLADILGLPPTTVLVSVNIQTRDRKSWQTTDDTPEPLGQQIRHRLEGILEELVRVLTSSAGLESVFRTRMEKLRHPGRVKVELPEGLSPVDPRGVFAKATMQKPDAFYVAALLLRGAVAEAEAFVGEAERASTSSLVGTKPFPVWPAVLARLEAQKAEGTEPTPLPPADWDFAAFDAQLDAQALDAQAPDEPAVTPVVAPSKPGAVNPLVDRVDALLALPPAWMKEGEAIPASERQRWYGAQHVLKTPLDPAQSARIVARLDDLPERVRSGSTPEEAFPVVWAALRVMSLPNSAETTPPTLRHAVAHRGLSTIDVDRYPGLTSIEGTMSSHLELMKLVAELPGLTALNLTVTDAPLAAAVKEGAVDGITTLRCVDYKGFDKSAKALGKAAPALRHLDLSKVTPAAAKSLGKSAVAPHLESFALETSDKGWADLLPLWERFARLRSLTLRSAKLEGMKLPETVGALSLMHPNTAGFDMAAQGLALQRYRVQSYKADVMRLALESAPTMEELDLHLPWDAITPELATVPWPKLQALELHLTKPENKNVEALVAWLGAMPRLHSLHLTVGLTAEEERAVLGAVPELQMLTLQSPTALSSMQVHGWPSLRLLSVHLRHPDKVKVPFHDADAQFILDHMPALAYLKRTSGVSALSETTQAALTERLAGDW